jgi:hypothetical protein
MFLIFNVEYSSILVICFVSLNINLNIYFLLWSASLHFCYNFRLYKTCVTFILALVPLLLWKFFCYWII